MAKGNMLQGMARGKVGDIVFSRLNGEQISRVRNRNPKNPRTNAQLYQRAIMATVMQAYSAGKEIFDHSFQGKSVGAANQRRFMSLNAKKLRDQIAADLQQEYTENQIARVVYPGAISPVATPLIVSEGNYTNKLFSVVRSNQGVNTWNMTAPTNGETVANYASRVGLIAGDIYTYVAFYVGSNWQNEVIFQPNNISSEYAKVIQTNFKYIRCTVKDNLSSVNQALTTMSQIFDIEGLTTEEISHLGLSLTMTAFGGYGGYSAVIRSRKDEDLRSNAEMILENPHSIEWGIASAYLLDIWKNATVSVGDSDLILEGGGEANTPVDTEPGFDGD